MLPRGDPIFLLSISQVWLQYILNRKKSDRKSRLRIYVTNSGGGTQVLSVDDKINSYGIDSDTKMPVDYMIIDNNGDGESEKVINLEVHTGGIILNSSFMRWFYFNS